MPIQGYANSGFLPGDQHTRIGGAKDSLRNYQPQRSASDALINDIWRVEDEAGQVRRLSTRPLEDWWT